MANETVDFRNITYLNQTNHLNNRISVEEEELSDDWEIPRLLNLSFKPVVVLFGTFGNVLSFIVMRRGSLKEVSTCFYMSMLAVADTGTSDWLISIDPNGILKCVNLTGKLHSIE